MTVSFRLYGPLNECLPGGRRGLRFRQPLDAGASVGEAIGVLGVPAFRVEVAVVNGMPVTLAHRLAEGDRVALYPRFESIDLGGIVRAGDEPRR